MDADAERGFLMMRNTSGENFDPATLNLMHGTVV